MFSHEKPEVKIKSKIQDRLQEVGRQITLKGKETKRSEEGQMNEKRN